MIMTIVKITIVAWVITLVVRFFVSANISKSDLMHYSITGKLKTTPGRVILAFLVVASIGLTVASIIWFLFFSGVI